MVDKYLPPKLGVNQLDRFRENNVYGRRMDGRSPQYRLLDIPAVSLNYY